MKKKFLLYVSVAVTLLFLGFTVYYIARNDESMYLNLDNSNSIYMNVDDVIEWPIVWTKPYKDTTLTVLVGNENVLSYDKQSKNFIGIGGGYTSVTITSSNKNFGPFVFEVYVGDGKFGTPYVIKTAEDLAKIGTDSTYTAEKHYALANDIDLKSYNNGVWNPISEFGGNFDGKGHTIYNLSISNATHGGLFKTITGTGTVENVKFEKVSIEGEYDYLGVVSAINSGMIGKVSVSGTIINKKAMSVTGGIVGLNNFDGSPAYINMCSANVSGYTAGDFGGLVGLNYSSAIINSHATVNYTTNNGLSVGGLVGENQSSFDATNNVYYASAIIKSYVVVNKLSIDGNFQGAVVGNNIEEDNNNTLNRNIYNDVIYVLAEGVSLNAIHGDEVNPKATISQKSKSDMLILDTYSNYNFDTVWTLSENEYAKLNFLGNYETIILKGIGQEYNSDTLTLEEFLSAAAQNPENEVTYYVTSNKVLNLNGAEWKTIASNVSNPLKASIIVEDGASLTIKNFTLSGNNSSFFGHIAKNTIISGITFEDVTVTSNAQDVAVVATSLDSGAALQNITVKNFTISSSASNASAIVAINRGNVENVSVSGNNTISIEAKVNTLKNIGGIVANNAGLISASKVNGLNIQLNTSSENGNFNIGGVSGYTSSNISSCGVDSFTISTTNEGAMYIGGVAGYAGENVTINKSYSKANLKTNTNNENAYVSGVVSYLPNTSNVVGSAFKGIIESYNVAGLVSVNYGKVEASYSEGTIKGINVAGLTTVCHGTITNCYTLSTLVGTAGSSTVSGITGLVGATAQIDKCLSSASFQGSGSHFAESASEFRTPEFIRTIASFRGDVNYGNVSNLVIINYGNAKVQSSFFGQMGNFFSGNGWTNSGWIDASESDCKGANDYQVLKEQAGFDSSVWNFENNGSLPTLKNAVVVE